MANNNQEVLEKAIQKAIDGGWKPLVDGEVIEVAPNQFTRELHLAHKAPWRRGRYALGQSVASVLVSHNFAKALWGDGPISDKPPIEVRLPKWQYHLQRMVIADDPISYLEANL